MSTQRQMSLTVAAADSANLTTIFILKQHLASALIGLGGMFVFPFAAATALLQAGLALYATHKAGYTDRSFINFLVEGMSALIVTGAVIGIFAASAVFAILAPIYFTAVAATKALYQGITALWAGVKYYQAKDAQEKEAYKEIALASSVGALVNGLAAVGLGLVMVAGHLPLAIIGVVAGAVGAVYAVYQLLKTKKPETVDAASAPKAGMTTHELFKSWGIKRQPQVNLELETTNNARTLPVETQMKPYGKLVEDAVVEPLSTIKFSK